MRYNKESAVDNQIEFPLTDPLARRILESGYTEAGVTGIDVATQLPSPLPEQFVKLFTLPGREISPRTMWCQVVALVYDATDDLRCAALARTTGNILRRAPDVEIDGEQWVTEPCEKAGPFPTRDPEIPDYIRYQVNVTWTVQSSVNQ